MWYTASQTRHYFIYLTFFPRNYHYFVSFLLLKPKLVRWLFVPRTDYSLKGPVGTSRSNQPINLIIWSMLNPLVLIKIVVYYNRYLKINQAQDNLTYEHLKSWIYLDTLLIKRRYCDRIVACIFFCGSDTSVDWMYRKWAINTAFKWNSWEVLRK